MAETKNVIWAGLDVGKASFVAALDDASATERRKVTSLPCRKFKRNQDELKKFFQWAQELFPEAEIRIVMESTGCYSQQLDGWIGELHPDVAVTIENAGNIHAFIQSLNLPHKTDRLDAQAIARFGTERQPKPTPRPSKTILVLRDLCHTRTALIKAKVEFQNRQETLSEPFSIEINSDIRREIELMCTLPGVSFVSASEIIAELGSLKQYSAKELSSLSGLAPRIKESGSSVHASYMSRRSSGRLRQILYLDSMIGVKNIPVLQEFHQRLLEKGKKKMTARCACMRKMLLILRSIVVHQRPYRPDFSKKVINSI